MTTTLQHPGKCEAPERSDPPSMVFGGNVVYVPKKEHLLPGQNESLLASQILALIKHLPPSNPLVNEIRGLALKLYSSAGAQMEQFVATEQDITRESHDFASFLRSFPDCDIDVK